MMKWMVLLLAEQTVVGLANTQADTNNNGRPNSTSLSIDSDLDGIVDWRDLDSDNDGIPDLIEANGVDRDGDGIANIFDDMI